MPILCLTLTTSLIGWVERDISLPSTLLGDTGRSLAMAEEDWVKMAFTTPWGLFQFLVMPFGLSGAPVTFHRLMDCLLQGTETFAAAYLDDLVIFSESWEDHCEQVRQVLQRLRDHDLIAKPSQC